MRATLPLVALMLLVVSPTGTAMSADEAVLGLAMGDVSPAESLMAQLTQWSAAAQLPRPPGIIYRDATATCDVDGDGELDVLVNNLTLSRAPSHSGAASELQVVSGRDGALLWKVDNLFAVRMPTPSAIPYYARGQSFPSEDATAHPSLDLDGDGVCDVVAVGGEGLAGFSTPFLGEPSISNSIASVRALSGRDGSELWRADFQGTVTSANEPLFGFAENEVYRGYLTGVLPFESLAGPRVLTKTTDMRYERQAVPFGVSLPSVDPNKPILKGAPETEDIRVTDRIQLRDATTGEVLWERVLGSESPSADIDARYTNVTWLAGVADLDGDDAPDVILDQMVITTPRSTEANHPVTGETLFRYGRGVRVTTLDGADGATLWNAVLLDPLAAEANVEQEETRETLAWTRTSALGDIDGDGLDDLMSSWVSREESLTTSLAGAFRTHFAPLSGANGTAFWDVRQQGWGVARPLDVAGPARHLGLGMLDVPAVSAGDSMFPPKFVRLLGVDALSGKTLWSDERSFAQNSFLSYNLALSQFETTLAPHDWDMDGILDLVSAAQPSARNGRDQVLMATSSHTYDVRAGSDGRILGTITAWGPDGRVVECPGAEASLTVLSGHARRVEVARYDPMTGERLWRNVLHNDPAPRAATTAMDMTALGATCSDLSGSGPLLGVDLQAYSHERRHEVVPVLAALDAEGGARWVTPELQGSPPGDALFQASIDDAPPATSAIVSSALVALAVGGLVGFSVLALLARRGSALLAAGMVLVLLAPGALALAAPLALPASPAVSRADREAAAARAFDVAALPSGAGAAEPVMSRFADKDTVSFPYDVGDVDGDGYGDLVLDQYCRSGDACRYGIYIPDDMTSYLTGSSCDYLHDLVGVSGVNGTPTWSVDITVRGPVNSCGASFVFGTFPTSQGVAILVYHLQGISPALFGDETALFHNITAYLARDGTALWTYSAVGYYNSGLYSVMTARDFEVLPIVRDGAIFLQGVGWASSASDTVFPVVPGYPLSDGAVSIHSTHDPLEWLARIDPETGAEMWKVDTFQPQADRNVLPRILRGDRLDAMRYWGYFFVEDVWWSDQAGHGDLTGDGVADVVYTVVEWSKTPGAKTAGGEGVDTRLVVYDGATGQVHLDQYVGLDLPYQPVSSSDRYYSLSGENEPAAPVLFEPAGDVDGDGAQDILAHTYIRAPEWRQDMTLISGATGEALWTESSIRDLRALVVGDADGDGGDDFLLLDWYGHEGTPAKEDDFVTPRENPLSMRSGRTGAEIWRAMTYAAPADILESFRALQRNGRVDIDADGVGDFFSDDPLYLDDQTVVHQISFLSGRDGSALRTVRTVGAFGIPAGAGDLDEDGRGEVAILTGDVSDMWITVYDGASGAAEWSRRVVSLPSSGFTQALPQFRLQQLAQPTEDAFVLTFHMQVTQTYTYIGFCIGCSDEDIEGGERVGEMDVLVPQILHADGGDGSLGWALPALTDVDVLARTLDATPGALAFEDVFARASASGLASLAAREARPFALPVLGSFLVGLGLVLGGGIALVRFQRRFEGVPELE